MHFNIALLLSVLAQATTSTAACTSTASHSLTKRLHDVALKHSAGLAKDLRTAFGGVLVNRQPSPVSGSKLRKRNAYCISQRGSGGQVPLGGNGNGTTTHRPSSTSTSRSSGASPTSTGSGAAPSATSNWKLVESHQGSDFFSGWDFFTGGDPTHGTVEFIDQGSAQSGNLIEVNDKGNAIMRIETTPQVASTRQSVRITSKSNFDGGLFIMDSVHMPTGCATWPAFWTNGPNWPAGGEIDIVEGVNNYTNNQATIHTDPGCSISTTSPTALSISGSVVGGTNCAAAESGNQGCGMRSPDGNSFGGSFNDNNGGVYAMQWDDSGVAIFFFPRGSVPSDIDSGSPDPSKWGTAQARWPASSCSPFEFFKSHSIIFDTTLCGDWAGSAWSTSGLPGQDQSCAQRTGFPTCEAFVKSNGASFSEAYWEVSSVKVYQQNS